MGWAVAEYKYTVDDSSAIILTIVLILLAHSEHCFPGFIYNHYPLTVFYPSQRPHSQFKRGCHGANAPHALLLSIAQYVAFSSYPYFPPCPWQAILSSLPTSLVLQRRLLLQATHGKLFSSLPTFLVSTPNYA
jgi:hypothetical protein